VAPVETVASAPPPMETVASLAPLVETVASASPPMERAAAISAPTSAVPSRDVPATAVRDAAEPIDARILIGVDIGCLIVTAALAVAVLLGIEGTFRLLLAIAFTSVVPGWALVRRLGLAATATGAALAVPSSLAICAGASVVMVWAHAWQPLTLLWALSAVSAAVLGWILRTQIGSLTRKGTALGR
jgi:hypothetical protein